MNAAMADGAGQSSSTQRARSWATTSVFAPASGPSEPLVSGTSRGRGPGRELAAIAAGASVLAGRHRLPPERTDEIDGVAVEVRDGEHRRGDSIGDIFVDPGPAGSGIAVDEQLVDERVVDA